jgi:hypothetical protein
MGIQTQLSDLRDGSIVAREATLAGLTNTRCYRCGQDPDKAHDRDGFCPAFSNYGEVGRWIPTSKIVRVLAKFSRKPVRFKEAHARLEETEGPATVKHSMLGVYSDNKYIGRLDYPTMPEFTLWAKRPQPDMLYKGWRAALEELSLHLNIPRATIERELGVTLSEGTEAIRRRKLGFF